MQDRKKINYCRVTVQGERKVPWDQCYIQFLETNPYLTIGTAVAAFYLPVMAMCWLYGRIFFETKRRRADLFCLQAHHHSSSVHKDDDSSDGDVSWPSIIVLFL